VLHRGSLLPCGARQSLSVPIGPSQQHEGFHLDYPRKLITARLNVCCAVITARSGDSILVHYVHRLVLLSEEFPMTMDFWPADIDLNRGLMYWDRHPPLLKQDQAW
jgi:hypothetical protein